MADPYLYADIPVLKNKLDIRDEKVLDLVEAEQSRANMMLLYERGFSDFTPAGLCEIHRFLFGDIYDWAGEYRIINIEKREKLLAGQSVWYSNDEDIPRDLENAFQELLSQNWPQFSRQEFVRHLTTGFPKIWQVHPFREGNTRTLVMLMTFASRKSAIFLILPEEDPSKNFMAGLMIQTLSRELFAVADENGGKLKNRVVLFCDELGTMPAFDILPLFSAGRSRKLTLVPIIQSLAQLEKNYGKEGAEIIQDNVQDTIFGGFAPNSQTAEVLSEALGNRTVMSGSISRGKNDPSRSLQMIERRRIHRKKEGCPSLSRQ